MEPYRAHDSSVVALNILPPGQGGYLTGPEFLESGGGENPPDHYRDQLEMYAALVAGEPGLTSENLNEYFKDASFGVKPEDITREYSPREGVIILRDSGYNVPHIYGVTRGDAMFGAGYATAEDRLFMLDVLRYTGRGRLSEFLGASESNLAMDCAQYGVADYTEAELQAMIDEIPAGADQALAAQAQQDVADYAEGINAYIDEVLADPEKLPAEYTALQVLPEEWTTTDTAAVASLIGGSLGVGGGGELGNAAFLEALGAQGYGPLEQREILDDLRFTDDPEAPSSTDDPFPWNTDLGPVDPASVAVPEAGSVVSEDEVVEDSCSGSAGPLPVGLSADGPFGSIPLRFPETDSNALLVGSELSKNGLPMAVVGPQIAYWSPEIVMELDMHAPGLHARGIGFPGISLYVLLGRGDGYGYSATSANGDLVDIRAVELCEPAGGTPTIESTHYVRHDGACTPIAIREDSWLAKPSAGGQGLPQEVTISTERVELSGLPGSTGLRGGTWGIVQARGIVAGKPVAFARQRVTYGAELDSALAYVEAMNPDIINGASDFQRAFGRFNFTFNWFYVDDENIAYQLGGAHPIRAPETDLDLPVWDETKWGWQGLLPFEGLPKDLNPEKGWITSWNNKHAPGFRSADDNWGYTPVDRVLPLNDGIEAAAKDDGKVDLVELVQVMGSAATVDLRGYAVLPVMLDVIGDPGTPRLGAVVDLLKAWHQAGAHRRDLDGDGQYEDQPAIAVMDAWWQRAVRAIFEPVLKDAYDDLPYPTDNAPADPLDHNGDAFNNGFFGHVHKDLRTVLDRPVTAPFSRGYCGGGDLAACRTALLNSLDQAVAALESAQGTDPAAWDVDEQADEIGFSNIGLVSTPVIPWQNRPTFQQVLQFQDVGGGTGGSCPRLGKGLTQILGTSGPDVLVGTSGDDLICGFGGRDRLRGSAGNDRLFGAGGRDTLRGGGGKDLLVGGAGKDRLSGGTRRDRCRGGPGDDRARRCERGHA